MNAAAEEQNEVVEDNGPAELLEVEQEKAEEPDQLTSVSQLKPSQS